MIKKNYIPTINISSLLDNKFETNESLRVIKKIQKACVDVGFFQYYSFFKITYTNMGLDFL